MLGQCCNNSSQHRRFSGDSVRKGVATLEFVVFAPILLIFLVAIAQFGLVFANLQTVELASQMATKIAAEADRSDVTSGNAALMASIQAGADEVLATHGMTSAGITLEHTLSGGSGSFTRGTCTAPGSPSIPAEGVRVSVCLDLSELTPDMLSGFGFTTAGRTARQTTTLRFEGS